MLDDTRKALAMLPPRLRWWWAGMIPLSALAAAAEALGAAVVFGFLGVVANREEATNIPVIGFLVPWVSDADDRTLTVGLGVGLIVFYVLRNMLLAGVTFVHEGLVQRSIVAVSDDLFWSYLTAPYTFHLSRNSANLIQQIRVSVDSAYQLVLSSAAYLASELLVAVALVTVLSMVSPLITLVAVGLTVLLLVLPNPMTRKFFLKSGEQRQEADEELLSGIQQSLGGLKEVRLAWREHFFHDWVIGQRATLGRVLHHRATMTVALRLMIETAFVTTILISVIVVTLRLGPGTEVLTILGLFAYATFRLVPSTNRITMYLNHARAGHAYVASVYADFTAAHRGPRWGAADTVPPPPVPRRDRPRPSVVRLRRAGGGCGAWGVADGRSRRIGRDRGSYWSRQEHTHQPAAGATRANRWTDHRRRHRHSEVAPGMADSDWIRASGVLPDRRLAALQHLLRVE